MLIEITNPARGFELRLRDLVMRGFAELGDLGKMDAEYQHLGLITSQGIRRPVPSCCRRVPRWSIDDEFADRDVYCRNCVERMRRLRS